ncbi:SCO family protein [Natronorarus salvus]|uniref:SCO family protein n=1 Tax=Natronorarus salvus TaxID=3117733 RepID=UPI002F2668F7
MDRRAYLAAVVAAGTLPVAGCLGDDSPTVLARPESQSVDSEDYPFPAHGEELPEVTLPSPLHDREVRTTEFVGERETLLTFVFTRCPGPCPALTTTLAQVQVRAADEGYAEEVALLPTTFDPEYDVAERLRAFSEANGASVEEENWQFLRPESPDRAEAVITDSFGVPFEEVPLEETEGAHGEHDDADRDDHADDGEGTTFVHANLLVLVNRDGYVERAYDGPPPTPTDVLDDLHEVREGMR